MNWNAANAIATFGAVLVALFGEKFWAWWRRPQPSLKVFDRLDRDQSSVISLSIENSGSTIENAKVFWVATRSKSEVDGKENFVRAIPRSFSWLVNESKDNEPSRSGSRSIYGEEVFNFLFSERDSSNWWRPHLSLPLEIVEGPFAEFHQKPDPNFEITIYLQLKGENYSSEYWPVRLTYDSGTVGGWVAYPLKEISAGEFKSLFPNHTENHFKQATRRLHQ